MTKIQKGILSKTFGEPNFILPFSDKYLRIFNEYIIGLAKSNLEWLKHNPQAMKNLIKKYQNTEYTNENTVDLDAPTNRSVGKNNAISHSDGYTYINLLCTCLVKYLLTHGLNASNFAALLSI